MAKGTRRAATRRTATTTTATVTPATTATTAPGTLRLGNRMALGGILVLEWLYCSPKGFQMLSTDCLGPPLHCLCTAYAPSAKEQREQCKATDKAVQRNRE
jgi:hypothetical protein